MPMPNPLRADFDARKVRLAAQQPKDGPQERRLLTLAAIYEGASRVRKAAPVTEVPCWAHARRKSFDPAKPAKAPIAHEAVRPPRAHIARSRRSGRRRTCAPTWPRTPAAGARRTIGAPPAMPATPPERRLCARWTP